MPISGVFFTVTTSLPPFMHCSLCWIESQSTDLHYLTYLVKYCSFFIFSQSMDLHYLTYLVKYFSFFHLYLWFQFTFLILDLDPDPCLLNPSLVLHQPGVSVLQCSWCGVWCNACCSSWWSAWCGAWFGMSVSNGALRRLTRNWSPSIQMQKSFKVHQYAPCVHT